MPWGFGVLNGNTKMSLMWTLSCEGFLLAMSALEFRSNHAPCKYGFKLRHCGDVILSAASADIFFLPKCMFHHLDYYGRPASIFPRLKHDGWRATIGRQKRNCKWRNVEGLCFILKWGMAHSTGIADQFVERPLCHNWTGRRAFRA